MSSSSRAGATGLIFTSDEGPGIRRRRAGKGFVYLDARGRKITAARTIERIRALAIPPAWSDVWICAKADGHLQGVGRDAKGRKQYRYHPEWRAHQEQEKYERLIDFGDALPAIRRSVARDLRRRKLDHERVVATVVHLLETTLIRVGNDEYARTNDSYGLTTLRDRQVRIDGSELRFVFQGKSGQRHDIALADRRVARIVRECQDLPGQRLFQYEDTDGAVRPIGSNDVNEYLRSAAAADFTAKDFRTWMGTLYTAAALAALEPGPADRHGRPGGSPSKNGSWQQSCAPPVAASTPRLHHRSDRAFDGLPDLLLDRLYDLFDFGLDLRCDRLPLLVGVHHVELLSRSAAVPFHAPSCARRTTYPGGAWSIGNPPRTGARSRVAEGSAGRYAPENPTS